MDNCGNADGEDSTEGLGVMHTYWFSSWHGGGGRRAAKCIDISIECLDINKYSTAYIDLRSFIWVLLAYLH